MNYKLKKFTFLILSSFFTRHITAENISKVDFYGIASKDADSNMLSMTEDLYFTQLKELNLEVSDFRSKTFTDEYFTLQDDAFLKSEKNHSAVYVLIKKLPSAKWESTVFLKELESGKKHSFSKEYDSYYKILMESKITLSDIYKKLLSQDDSAEAEKVPSAEPAKKFTTEMLAGTWTGEEYVNKIVIMRGGRGFVIFKNGASMNISLMIDKDSENNSIIISQTGSNNASYYPEIDRKLAMENAITADPVKWTMTYSRNTLSGIKRTLLMDSEQNVTQGEVKVTWTKMN